MKLGSLCSGIGGLELGVERALGARTAWQAEIDPAASAVLAEHWPGVPNIGDIRDTAAMTPVDVLTAGYP
ncbi:MAG TPA: DNA cytosine methyltransferase, partial [Microthrixaceae bacterium]|nr:DNA cytosine methyltransferase [Microthrixaceae bacterium]